MATEYKLTYFDMHGRGEVARLLFVVSGTKFQDERVSFASWPELKPKTPYGQLPLLEYQGKQYCQSEGIYRFLARQFDLYGKDAIEGLEIDQILGTTDDILSSWGDVAYKLKGEEQEKATNKLIGETLPKYIAFLTKLLGSNDYFVGNKLSLADLMVYDFLGDKMSLVKGWKSGCQEIDDLIHRVGSIPNIKDYVSSRP